MNTALLVIDAQQSFTQRHYWSERELPRFLDRLQTLIDACERAGVPVLQIFHVEPDDGAGGPFSLRSGWVETLPGLRIQPTAIFHKNVHSAMFARDATGLSLDDWLKQRSIEGLIITGIRTEQCCETTTRHASDLGYAVTYAIDATLTFPMTAESGRTYSAEEIMERTELVLAQRFAEVVRAEAVRL